MPIRILPAGGLPAGLGVLLLATATFTTACSSEPTSAPELGVSAAAFTQIVEGTDDFLQPGSERRVEAWIGYVDGDSVVKVPNGGSFVVDGLTITLEATPYPPTQFETTAVLTVSDAAGAPVAAHVDAWYDMVFMTHGLVSTEIEVLEPGRFRMPLDMFMFGPWVVKTTVEVDGQTSEVPLVFYVWPNTP